jgi:hypothetical protein
MGYFVEENVVRGDAAMEALGWSRTGETIWILHWERRGYERIREEVLELESALKKHYCK